MRVAAHKCTFIAAQNGHLNKGCIHAAPTIIVGDNVAQRFVLAYFMFCAITGVHPERMVVIDVFCLMEINISEKTLVVKVQKIYLVK